MSATRIVHALDARQWLAQTPTNDAWSFVTSLPDVSELGGVSLENWKRWFQDAAAQILSHASPASVAIFYQTDIKKAGVWIDKGYLVQRAAEEVGSALLWHKVACRKPPGTVTFGRPAYTHLLCFSKTLRPPPPSIPDVMADMGPLVWTRGMGEDACVVACRFVRDVTQTRVVVDPYCGKGTVLAAANHLGLDAIGVELSGKRARQARTLGWPPRPERAARPADVEDEADGQ